MLSEYSRAAGGPALTAAAGRALPAWVLRLSIYFSNMRKARSGWSFRQVHPQPPKGVARTLQCPRCRMRQYGAAARCSNCGKDLLHGRSPRLRYYAGLVAVFAFAVVGGVVLGAERIPLAYPIIALGLALAVGAALIAVTPVSTASRHQRRALANLRSNPELALLDLSRAIELDAADRSLLIDRARAYRLLGRHHEAAADLQAYLRQTRGEPPDRVDQARTLLARVEAGGGLRWREF